MRGRPTPVSGKHERRMVATKLLQPPQASGFEPFASELSQYGPERGSKKLKQDNIGSGTWFSYRRMNASLEARSK